MRRLTAVLACAALALAGCGDDDDDAAGDGGGGGGELQNEVADQFIDEAEGEVELDDDCVRETAAQFSDDDAQKVLDSDDVEGADLSPEGLATLGQLVGCIDPDAMIDQVVDGLPDTVDGDCVRDALEGVDLSEMLQGGTPPSELTDALTECAGGG